MTKGIKEYVKETWKPWVWYTSAHTALNCAVIASQNEWDLEKAVNDSSTNIPFFAFTNAIYANAVNGIMKLTNKYGSTTQHIASSLFSVAVSAGFYAYAVTTNDTDPTVPSLVAGTIGLTLTNKQVYDTNKSK